jgi:hypothetical protein
VLGHRSDKKAQAPVRQPTDKQAGDYEGRLPRDDPRPQDRRLVTGEERHENEEHDNLRQQHLVGAVPREHETRVDLAPLVDEIESEKAREKADGSGS